MRHELGKFEDVIVNAVFHLRDDAYGIAIHARAEELSTKPIAIGAVYTTLSRLEEKGLLESHTGEPTAKRGGRRKRYYALTTRGLEMLLAETMRVKRLYPGLVS